MITKVAEAPDGAEQSDEDIVRQVLDGNVAMFELLMRRYNERVYRAARAIVRDEHEAEDVMQQAYVNAFTHLRQFTGAARFSTWLTRIAVNESTARMRRRGRYQAFDEQLTIVEPFMSSDVSADPERQAFTGELRGLLEWATDRLPDGIREVFVLRDVEGLSTSEVAACLAISEDLVKTRLSRGRARLRRTLLERTGASAPDAFRFHRPRCDRVVARVLAQIAGGPSPGRLIRTCRISAGSFRVHEEPQMTSTLLAPAAQAQMLIRRPVADVFRAFVDPGVTSRFWFSRGSGPLTPGARVRWEWEMYGVATDVHVKGLDENRRILIEWDGPENPTSVEWTFEPKGHDRTYVTVRHWGFRGGPDDVVKQAIDSMGGFSLLLASAKAYLEHAIELNVVEDHVPDALVPGWTGRRPS